MPRLGWRTLGTLHGKTGSTVATTTAAAHAYVSGLYRKQYSGWPNQNTASPTFFNTGTVLASSVINNFDITLTSAQTNLAYQWVGYIKPNYTGTWTFTTNGVSIDDCLTVWIGNNALNGYTTSNALLNVSVSAGSNTISLTSGTYYPIRVQYANNSGPGTNTLYYSHTGQTATNAWSGLLYYNPTTKGF